MIATWIALDDNVAMLEVTQILGQIESGDPAAVDQLLPLVYDELRKLAAVRLAQETPGQTLQATGLVHEAFLRLVAVRGDRESTTEAGKERPGLPDFVSRGHFFAAAAIAMRRILIENARRKSRRKHGGELQRVELPDVANTDPDERLIALDAALTELALEDPQAAQVIELHHFAGLSHEQVAATLGITVYQARQKWTYGRAWLHNALSSG